MKLKKVMSFILAEPNKEDKEMLKYSAKEAVELLKRAIIKERVRGEVFIGGSYAKETMVGKDQYDVDVFVRFDPRIEDITSLLARAVDKAYSREWKIERVHGSRDYFKVFKNKRIVFEIVPVAKISNPKEARNVTDLSYFHVKYVKNKIKGKKTGREIALAKLFCKACGVYGAESYISGFSGYALECLVIHYRTFERMIKELVKVETQLILDPEKQYKNKNEIALSMNESKMKGPIIIVDPTWRERNVLAALNMETFRKFQEVAKKFLKNPKVEYFVPSKLDKINIRSEALKYGGELIEIEIVTLRQRGDIAGTKLKTFSKFLGFELNKSFVVHKEEFEYDGEQRGKAYYAVSPKKEMVARGPPVEMKRHAKEFRKEHPNSFVKEGILYSKVKGFKTAKEFLENWIIENKTKIKDMDIQKVEIK